MRRTETRHTRPAASRALFPALLPLLLLTATRGPAAAQGPSEPVRFPSPPVVVLAASDPPPLPPPPPHHTRNAALVTVGASVGIFGILLLLPEEITGWSASDRTWEGMQDEWRDFRRHVTGPPVWDHDHWFFNYVGHPYVGMHTYLMERNWGMSPLRSFLFSTAASVAFEYGIEAWAEPPSIQDLLTTSPGGAILGELNYRFTHHLRKGGLTTLEKVVVTMVNPVHVLQYGYR